ncbi:MAG: hypothetical protein J0H78_13695 [Rhizobiales bacterium]|nr:hypothetical protein [Hyphomicrobiales bacterium]
MTFRLTVPALALAALAAWAMPAPAHATVLAAPAAGIAAGVAQSGSAIEQVQYRHRRHYRHHRHHWRGHHWRRHRHCWTQRYRVYTPSGRPVWRAVRRCR